MTRHYTIATPACRIAVIGAGIAGLGAAHLLSQRHDVTLFEADDRLGGHSNTAEIDYDGQRIAVDTGFIVYNERNYPNLAGLFAELDVATTASDMSFSVSVADGALEWAGSNLATLFAQPSNLFRPQFHRMLRDVLRFNRSAPADLARGVLTDLSLGDYLELGGFGEAFRTDYLLPMAAAIWSAPLNAMLHFPAESFVRFFAHHGLLAMKDRPEWRTVAGGSREYVRRLMARFRGNVRTSARVAQVLRDAHGALVRTAGGTSERFDQVVIATHSDQARRLLVDADAGERRILDAIRYQPNLAVLHRDASLMPRRRRTWSSWNYCADQRRDLDRRVSLTYWMNRLQNIDPRRPLFVTMNPAHEPDPTLTFARYHYDHPLFDRAALQAQAELGGIQGRRHTWFCGAWCGYGFHEDGLKSAIAVARAFGVEPAWPTTVLPAATPPFLEPVVRLAAGD